MHKTVRRVSLVLGILVLTSAAVVLGLASFLQSDALKQEVALRLGTLLGQPVELEDVQVSFWPDVAVQVKGVTLKASPTAPVDGTLGEVRLQAALMPLLDKRLEILGVSVQGARLHLTLPKQEAPAEPAAAHSPTPNTGEPPPKVARLDVEDSFVTLEGGPLTAPVELGPISLHALDAAANHLPDVDLKLGWGGGTISIKGSVGPVTGNAWMDAPLDATVVVAALPWSVLAPWVPLLPAQIETSQAVLDGTVTASGKAAGPIKAHVQASMAGWKVASVDSAPLQVSGDVETLAGNTGFTLANGSVSLAGSTLAVAAKGSAPWNRQDWHVEAKGSVASKPAITLAKAFQVVLPPELSISGPVDVNAVVDGDRVHAKADASRAHVAWAKLVDHAPGTPLQGTVDLHGQDAPLVVAHVEGLTVSPPQLQAPLTNVGADVELAKGILRAKGLTMLLQGHPLTGEASWNPKGDAPLVQARVDVAQLDVDTLMAPNRDDSPSAAGNAEPPPKRIRLDLHAQVAALRAKGVDATKVVVHVGGDTRNPVVEPLSLDAMGGHVEGGTKLDLTGARTHHTSHIKLEAVRASDVLLHALGLKNVLRGLLSAEMAAAGGTTLATLQGKGSFMLDKVGWLGGDAFGTLGPSIETLTGLSLEGVDLASVRRVHGPLEFANGKVSCSALVMERENGFTLLSGWMNPDGTLDFLGRVALNESAASHLRGDWAFLKNAHGSIIVPFILKGTLDKPVLAPDAYRLAQAYAQHHMGDRAAQLFDQGRRQGMLPRDIPPELLKQGQGWLDGLKKVLGQ